ncbi:glycosyltransferase [Microbacterium sp. 179-I 1D1 NHS]|uniref:glycosyltransferase n=1 Tax=Microbacterium sp. 179-I 1D1 NHS TaxID=3374298 RepID=UPI00387A21BE
MVLREHYSMQTGQRFDSDDAAARHYFDEGWRTGIVPNPFIDAPEARFSLARAQLLRARLVALAVDASAPMPYRTSRWADADADSGPVDLTRRVREAPDEPIIMLGDHPVSWLTYVQRAEPLGDAARRIVEHGLIDTDFYAEQVGGARPLTPLAALDDLIANGELDGRMPNAFFEPEWYAVQERGLSRRGRPVSHFLDFVAFGEVGQASPHFWGFRYSQTLETQPPSLLQHFLEEAAASHPCPSSPEVTPVSRQAAEDSVRRRIGEYYAHAGDLHPGGPVLAHHARRHRQTGSGGTAIVFVDQRHLRSDADVARLLDLRTQTLAGLRVVVVAHDDAARPPLWSDVEDLHPHTDLVDRTAASPTFAAIIADVVDSARPHGWVIWSPDQVWEPDFLDSAVAALREDSALRAAVVVSPELPQPWLRTRDARWADLDDGVGVVFASSGDAPMLPARHLDMGVGMEVQIRIADSGSPCGYIEEALTSREGYVDGPFERRGAANAARSASLATFDGDPVPGVLVVIPTFEDWAMTVRAVRSVLRTTPESTRVSVVDNGSRRPVASILDVVFAGDPRVRVRRLPRNLDFALGSNIGASDGASDVVVFLNNDTEPQDGWLEPLLDTLADPSNVAVQPLLLYGDRTVQTAGTVFLGGHTMPMHLLPGMHPLDVPDLLDDYDFSALTAACLAVRYEDLHAVNGFDTHYVNGMEDVDLCLRLRDRGRLRLRASSRVLHYESKTPGRKSYQFENRARFARLWREALNRLDDRRLLDDGPVAIGSVSRSLPIGSALLEADVTYERRRPLTVSERPRALRWAIKTAATADHWGDAWGDTYFAHSLAGALRALGQEVVVDRSTAMYRPSAAWDDVTLTLRGLVPFLPNPDSINLLWVISHPELITKQELHSGFDAVFAAGGVWAERIAAEWGLPIRTLLQATDTRIFHPEVEPDEHGGVLFVGRTRGIARPIVLDAIEAGADLRVHGDDGWENFIDPTYVKSSGLPNAVVPAAYAGADVVLNDHWREMAENGFLSNRLFDAAATGARIVSDRVPGMAEIFGSQVQTYGDVDELRRALDIRSAAWPSPQELQESARRIVREHSFDARARVLLDAAHAARKVRSAHA